MLVKLSIPVDEMLLCPDYHCQPALEHEKKNLHGVRRKKKRRNRGRRDGIDGQRVEEEKEEKSE